MLLSVSIILITSLIIYYFGNKFASASSEIGDYFNLSRSVKGATLDAIASSFPEFMIAVFSVVLFKEFGIGVGTIAGSAFFNTLIIPSVSVLLSPVVFRIGKEVMARDAIFFNISIFALLLAIVYSPVWGVAISVIFVGIYFWYIDLIIDQTQKYRIDHEKKAGQSISVTGKIFSAIIYMIIMGVAAYFLTDSAITISEFLGIPSIIIGFSIISISTSIPDAIIGFSNARKGRVDDVVSNVFGSNIFNILIALGVPLFLFSAFTGRSVSVVFEGADLIIGLLISVFMINYFIVKDYVMSKREAWMMIIFYFAFIIYLFYKSVGL